MTSVEDTQTETASMGIETYTGIKTPQHILVLIIPIFEI
jgi:hypothetical protein